MYSPQKIDQYSRPLRFSTAIRVQDGHLARAVLVVPADKVDAHGPLVPLLLIATMVTGLVDAVSYLGLGHIFVANMTGNVILLGFAAADTKEFSVVASLTALAAFLIGALAGGRLGLTAGHQRARLFMIATCVETLLFGATLTVMTVAPNPSGLVRYALVVLLALAMGLQNAVARRLAVPGLTTTVLTMTLTALAADSSPAGGKNPNAGRHLAAIITMLLGAAIGAILIFEAGVSAVLALALALLAFNGIAAYRYSS